MNPTLRKFGYPESLIGDFRHWCVLLRPAQATLGALILGAKSDAVAFSDLPPEAFTELHQAVSGIEVMLRGLKPYDRINYLMLMMVDPHVHFHVLPRYATAPSFGGMVFADSGWPGPPDLKSATDLADETRAMLFQRLQTLWPKA
jgi:diadenosine tetraphosphate (Ap4A) HIT family hydrolase